MSLYDYPLSSLLGKKTIYSKYISILPLTITSVCVTILPQRKIQIAIIIRIPAAYSFGLRTDIMKGVYFMYENIQQTVIDAVANHLDLDPSEINGDTSLTNDLMVDSLDFVEICMVLEDIYGIDFDTDEMAVSMTASTTISDVVDYLVSLGVTD